VICFSRSYLYWLTKKQSSHGLFQLDAILDCKKDGFLDPYRFVLGAAVPAGRMYETAGPLLREPAYSFQMIAGLNEHTILRRDLSPSRPTNSSDSFDLHSKHFHSLFWRTTHVQANHQKPDLLANIPPQSTINIILEFRQDDLDLRLEAPLRHWNYRQHSKSWQIETGPLLWPLNTYEFQHSLQSSVLTTAWLHANNDNRVTISGDRLVPHEISAHLSLLVPF